MGLGSGAYLAPEVVFIGSGDAGVGVRGADQVVLPDRGNVRLGSIRPGCQGRDQDQDKTRNLCGDDAFDLDLLFQVARLGKVKGQLHAKPCFGCRAKCL